VQVFDGFDKVALAQDEIDIVGFFYGDCLQFHSQTPPGLW
jgi:hypothetical protein